MKVTMLVALLLAVGTTAVYAAEGAKGTDITVVAASGKIAENQYNNDFFDLVVHAPDATLQLNPVINKNAQRARLVQILAKSRNWEEVYTFAVLADAINNYPGMATPDRYVRSVRHKLEQEGMPTVQEESAIVISGIAFSGAIVQEHVSSGRKYYRGLFAAFRNGYILSFDLEAASPEKVKETVTRLVQFSATK